MDLGTRDGRLVAGGHSRSGLVRPLIMRITLVSKLTSCLRLT